MKFVTIIFCLMMGLSLSAQTPFSITQSRAKDVNITQASVGNAWFGSTLSYSLTGDQDFDDSFLLTSRIMYEIPTSGKVHLPVLGNVGIPITNIDFDNLEIGIYPYAPIYQEGTTVLVAHGGIRYRVEPDDAASASLQTTSILGGLEIAYKPNADRLPYTFSVTPVYDFYNLGVDNQFGVELTGIVPVASGLGVLVEWNVNSDSVLSIGVITNNLIN